MSAHLAEHERGKVVSVLSWVVWNFQLPFQYFFIPVNAYFTLPRSTHSLNRAGVSVAIWTSSFTQCGCSHHVLQWWGLRAMLWTLVVDTVFRALFACLQ